MDIGSSVHAFSTRHAQGFGYSSFRAQYVILACQLMSDTSKRPHSVPCNVSISRTSLFTRASDIGCISSQLQIMGYIYPEIFDSGTW